MFAMLSGMFILIWSSTGHEFDEPWWNEDAKLAVTFTTMAAVLALVFVLQQWTLFTWQKEDESNLD